MAREKRPIELRTVDDQPVVRQEVPRLGLDPQPVRLIPDHPEARQAVPARLEVPSVAPSDSSRRSHEPGVEVLIEAEEATLEAAEDAWDKAAAERRPVPWGWFALVGLLLSGAAAWSLTHIRQAEPIVAEEHKQAEQVVNVAAANDQEIQRSIERLESAAKAFCEAGSIEEMLPLVRHRETVRPLMESFYAQTPLQPLGFERIKTFQGAGLDSSSTFWVFSVVLGNGKTHNLLLEQEPSGNSLVDWETAVTYQPMNWDEYARQRPLGSTMDFRVYVNEDHFYSHEFADSRRWMSFRLTTLGGVETLFGYAPRGSEVATELQAMIRRDGTSHPPAILRLGLPPGMQSRRGVIIDKVLSSRWIYVDPPDSGS